MKTDNLATGCLIVLFIFLLIFAIIFGVVSGCYALVCWAFALTFSWPIDIAISVILFTLIALFK